MSISHFKVGKVQGALARALDFVCLGGAFATVSLIASFLSRSEVFTWPKPTASDIAGWPAQYVVLLLASLIGWNVVKGYLALREPGHSEGSTGHVSRLVRVALLWIAAIMLAIFVLKLRAVSRVFVFSYIILATLLIAVRDFGERLAARKIYQGRGIHRTALVIGNGTQARWLRQYLLDNYCPEPYSIVRRIDAADPDYLAAKEASGKKNHGASSHEVTEVFVAAADVGGDVSGLLPRLFERGTEAHIVPGIIDASVFKLALGNLGGMPIISLRSGAVTGLQAVVKRAFDFVVAAIVLTAAAPIMLIVALLVKCSSPGTVFFRQERVGKGGRRIRIYKFRTMHQDAEQILTADADLYRKYVEGHYKLPKGKDPRITVCGRILRQLSLDEVPQLINVL